MEGQRLHHVARARVDREEHLCELASLFCAVCTTADA